MSIRPLAIVLLAALTFGCGSSDGDVLDFRRIQAGEVVVEADPSGTSARLAVETTIAAVCAVAYGPTQELGRLATDQDMSGGAHRHHEPLLTGLQPDTEYFYRLQGVGEDGRLYQSRVLTFRTPAAAGNPSSNNVALGAEIVEVSSEFSDAYAAGHAVDGDLSTEWSSRGDGDDAYIVLDLGRTVDAAGVGFRTRAMSDGTAVTTSYTVTVDGSRTYGPFPAGPGLAVGDVSFTGRMVRFEVETSTGGNTGAVEVEVYAAP